MTLSPDILFDDDHLLIVNKPSGMLSEGGQAREIDLEQWGRTQFDRNVRCCHRLDRLTSGVMVLRKTRQYTRELAAQFAGSMVRKFYWALVAGEWPAQVTAIRNFIKPVGNGVYENHPTTGKPARSTMRVLGHSREPELSWLGILLKTGRTHQARLHCLAGGCPVYGDPLYGKSADQGLFGLHAREIRFRHPAGGDLIEISADPPASWHGLFPSIND